MPDRSSEGVPPLPATVVTAPSPVVESVTDAARVGGSADRGLADLLSQLPPGGEISFEVQSSHRGPLPLPSLLRAYADCYPDAVKIIFDEYVQQGQHRRDCERMNVQTSNRLAIGGQVIAGLIGVLVPIGGLVVIALGRNVYGLAAVITPLVGLVGVYLYGRHLQDRESEEKAKTRAEVAAGKPVEEITAPGTGKPDAPSPQGSPRQRKPKAK